MEGERKFKWKGKGIKQMRAFYWRRIRREGINKMS